MCGALCASNGVKRVSSQAGSPGRSGCFLGKLQKETFMLYWALMFLIVALLAGLFGFLGVASLAAGIAKVLFFLFLVLFLVSLLAGLTRRRPR